MPLYLAIYLRVKGNKELSFDTKKIIKKKLKLGVENRPLITDDEVEKAMVLHPHIDNYHLEA